MIPLPPVHTLLDGTNTVCRLVLRKVTIMLRVLIADDHAAVRKGVCTILSQRLDIEVCGEAENGREAIEKAKALDPDLIILDVTMPVLSGFEAAREIRKVLPKTPVLILTMHRSRQLIEEAKKLGLNGYVAKTQATETLLQAVDTVLAGGTFYPEIFEASAPL
jgi:DNA-binding NarL/FixJ family response regulator